MTKNKVLYSVKTTADGKDIKGFGIPKGTTLHITAECERAPFGDHHQILLVRVDNGTGIVKLMPETAVRDTEVAFKKL